MLVQPPARRPDVSLYRLGTEPVFFNRAQSLDPQARKTKCRLNTPLTPNPSCESDSAIVAMKSPNKTGGPAAEATERRAGAEENAIQQRTRRAQNRESVSQALERVREAARLRKKERFTALFHHITVDLLRLSFFALKRDAAPGADGVTWQDYDAELERQLGDSPSISFPW